MPGTRWKSFIRNSARFEVIPSTSRGTSQLVMRVRTTVRLFGPSSPQDEAVSPRSDRTGLPLSARLRMTCKEAALLGEMRHNSRLATAAGHRREAA